MIPLTASLGAGASDLLYVALLFALIVVPRVLQRYRLPGAITSLGLGALAGPGFGLFLDDPAVELLSTFGIVSLFLFAGLDVSLADLRAERRVVLQHVVLRLALVTGGALAAQAVFAIDLRAAAIVALALFTPSTGFILDSLGALGVSKRQEFWIRTKAIATELVALAVLFAVLQSTTAVLLTGSAAILIAMVVLLPWAFRWFAAVVVPHAPRSEFAFLMMVAVICAITTRELGVYYLVGAFVVGMAAQRFRERLPAIASEKMLHAVESFASVFVPFYFFHAGLRLRAGDFTSDALLVGAAFLVVAVPLRLAAVAAHRRITLGETLGESLRVTVPLLPTLVFTLVLAEILRDRFDAPPPLVGGLIVYTIVNTLIPGFVFRAPPPEFDTPTAPPVPQPEERPAP